MLSCHTHWHQGGHIYNIVNKVMYYTLYTTLHHTHVIFYVYTQLINSNWWLQRPYQQTSCIIQYGSSFIIRIVDAWSIACHLFQSQQRVIAKNWIKFSKLSWFLAEPTWFFNWMNYFKKLTWFFYRTDLIIRWIFHLQLRVSYLATAVSCKYTASLISVCCGIVLTYLVGILSMH